MAIGSSYEQEVQRLVKDVPEVLVVTDKHPFYEPLGTDQLVNGLYTKTRVGRFLPQDREGHVFLLDADLFVVNGGNPLDDFEPPEDADLGLVKYQGTYYFPEGRRKEIHDLVGGYYNSGFIWFRSHEVCRKISAEWAETYRRRTEIYGMARKDAYNEYDEPALMEVLSEGKWRLAELPRMWNNWTTPQEGDLFRQEHTVLNNPYTDIPLGVDILRGLGNL